MSPLRCCPVLCALVVAVVLPAALAVPKKYESGGFLPSPVSYYQQSGDQLAMESADQVPAASDASPATPAPNAAGPAGRSADQDAAGTEGKEPRFGFVGYSANGVQVQDPTYGTAAGPYGALRLDLGGVLLGALIGLGASLVLPKLLHGLAAHPHDGYKRSVGPRSHVAGEVDGDGVMASFSHILSRVDTALAEQNIDSTACLQRAVCTYVQSSATRSATGEASGVESLVDTAAKNSLVGYMLEGSSFKQAVDTGRKGGNCSKVYYKCPVNKDSLAAGIKSIISAAA
ncbi:uncharacterized protein LOC117643656 [Thrips palmi]|uniref:Uncharacterized protein LOC117643656 n=1 Tax=Thrips palmi TaxID=161013 RepID=A0A6P8YMZ5_THRPL|nr:uncharacterized protein LOC117643656 [Thrips palmi]